MQGGTLLVNTPRLSGRDESSNGFPQTIYLAVWRTSESTCPLPHLKSLTTNITGAICFQAHAFTELCQLGRGQACCQTWAARHIHERDHALHEREGGAAVTFHLFLQPARGNCGNPVKPGDFSESSGMDKERRREAGDGKPWPLLSLCPWAVDSRPSQSWVKWLSLHPCPDNCYRYLELSSLCMKDTNVATRDMSEQVPPASTRSTHKPEHRCTNCSCWMFSFAVLPRFGYPHHHCRVNICAVVCLSEWVAKHLVTV